jgi:hypothetical protein
MGRRLGSANPAPSCRRVLPLALPGVAATAINCFITGWKEYVFALVLTQSEPCSQASAVHRPAPDPVERHDGRVAVRRRAAGAGCLSSCSGTRSAASRRAPSSPGESTVMKIVEFEVVHVRPRYSFLRLHTDDGLVGIGEACLEGKARVVRSLPNTRIGRSKSARCVRRCDSGRDGGRVGACRRGRA